jgi:hypothetical protein
MMSVRYFGALSAVSEETNEGRETARWLPSRAEVKNAWSYSSKPIHLHGVVLG